MLYEAWSTGSPFKFKLEEPAISLIQPLLDKLGPDGIPCEEYVQFGLDSPDPEEHYGEEVVACAYDIGTQHFNTVKAGILPSITLRATARPTGLGKKRHTALVCPGLQNN